MFVRLKHFLNLALCLFTITLLAACQNSTRTEQKIKQDTAATDIEGSLVFNNITLDQADAKGRPLWKVKSEKATYSRDKKIAQIEKPSGDLYQDGKIVLRVSADSGEVRQDGKLVLLRGQITATDIRNGAVFKGDDLEWHPQDDLLVVRNNLKGNHPQLQATAKEARYFTRNQQVELLGQVAAISKNPDLQMKSDNLIWQIKQQKVSGDKRIWIERYKNKIVTDRVEADKSQVDLQTKIATLQQNVQLTSVDPPLLMSSNSAIWNVKAQTVVSEQPVRIVQQKENIILTANQGQLNLEQKVATLMGGVQAIGSKNQAKVYANQMKWDIPTQNVQASGNVIYQQINPPFNTTGPTAVGRLQDQSIVVTGEGGSRVVTKIIP
jgi:LPS export ABC transporter protein LptC